MTLGPIHDATKSLGYSWPSVHWWLSLTSGDQGVWAGTVASLVVAAAALATAIIAYGLGTRDAKERARLRATSADIAAGMLFTNIAALHVTCHQLERELKNSGGSAEDKSQRVLGLGEQLRRFLDATDRRLLADFAFEEKSMAMELAYALGSIEILPDLTAKASADIGAKGVVNDMTFDNACRTAFEFCVLSADFVHFCEKNFGKRIKIAERHGGGAPSYERQH